MRGLTLFFCLLAGCGARPDPLADLTLPPLPDWTDKYADLNTGDMRFFDISALMQAHGLTRLQAVEVQNHYRDASRNVPDAGPQKWFDAALAHVKAGKLESGLDEAALAKAKFIVVFDLDDTLYDQYYRAEGCADVQFTRADGKPANIMLVPGWDDAIRRIRALGGLVVIFSANRDTPTLENLKHWKLGETPLLEHPDIAGILTNSFLIRQSKHEGEKMRPISEASKDLRLFDGSLERVIIVDDNPTRLFQFQNTRVFKKFHGDAWCAKRDPALMQAYSAAMPAVVAEIEDSLAWMQAHPESTFRQAWLPYSMIGQVLLGALTTGGARSPADAIEYIRTHPELVDRRF